MKKVYRTIQKRALKIGIVEAFFRSGCQLDEILEEFIAMKDVLDNLEGMKKYHDMHYDCAIVNGVIVHDKIKTHVCCGWHFTDSHAPECPVGLFDYYKEQGIID